MSELELRVAWERWIAPLTSTASSNTGSTSTGSTNTGSTNTGSTNAALTDAVSAAEFDSVMSRHHEPHRHYHTITHVAWCVRHLERFEHLEIERGFANAAVFYHDVIYDPRRSDNEAASAALAASSLANLGWNDASCARVAALIDATAAHEPADDITTAAVIAADLAILATGPVDYVDYVNQVRREYGHLDNEQWRTGRAEVLEAFLARDAIYDVRVAPAEWEPHARANLTSELATLQR